MNSALKNKIGKKGIEGRLVYLNKYMININCTVPNQE